MKARGRKDILLSPQLSSRRLNAFSYAQPSYIFIPPLQVLHMFNRMRVFVCMLKAGDDGNNPNFAIFLDQNIKKDKCYLDFLLLLRLTFFPRIFRQTTNVYV